MLALICIERKDKQCHGSYMTKRWLFIRLEPHNLCYPGTCPNLVRPEETSNPRLSSEYIITDNTNNRAVVMQPRASTKQTLTRIKLEIYSWFDYTQKKWCICIDQFNEEFARFFLLKFWIGKRKTMFKSKVNFIDLSNTVWEKVYI